MATEIYDELELDLIQTHVTQKPMLRVEVGAVSCIRCACVAHKGHARENRGAWASVKSSQVSTLPIAKSQTRSKQNKDMHKCRSVYSERGVLLPVLTSGGQ